MIKTQHVLQTVLYGIFSFLITFIVSYIVIRDAIISLYIGLLDCLLKVFWHYPRYVSWGRTNRVKIAPAVVFLTGFSGAGKTTIANLVIARLKQKGIAPVLLDGDEIREAISITGFDEDSRRKHNLSVGFMAKLLEAQGNIVLVALIAPYSDIRQQIRDMCKNFIEVHVSTALEVCIERDTKGMYKKAINGDIKDFTGISAPYHAPKHAELSLDTANISAEECTSRIIQLMKKRTGASDAIND